MTAFDMDKLLDQTNDDEIKCMLLNVNVYKDMHNYLKCNNNTAEDFKDMQNQGIILDITPGTFNGSIATFTYVSELTLSNIYTALFEEAHGDTFQDLVDIYEEPNASEARQARLLTEAFNVFIIGNHLYINYDY